MRVLTTDPPPAEVETLLERRRKLGTDLLDEIWEGVIHMNPAPRPRHGLLVVQLTGALIAPAAAARLEVIDIFNLGEPDDFRIPDAGLITPGAEAVFLDTAALVIEVLSPGDETWEKLPFYAAHNVDEVLIADPDERTLTWLALTGGEYHPVQQSALIDLCPARLTELISWPAAGA